MIKMNKNQVLSISFLATVVFALLYTNYLPHTYCSQGSYCSEFFKFIKIVFLISTTLLPISIIAYFCKERIFSLWKKFTFIYLTIYLFSIIVSPLYGGAFLKIEKGTVAIFLTILYLILSLLFIMFLTLKFRAIKE